MEVIQRNLDVKLLVKLRLLQKGLAHPGTLVGKLRPKEHQLQLTRNLSQSTTYPRGRVRNELMILSQHNSRLHPASLRRNDLD